MAWGNLMQLSPFDVLTTLQPDYSTSNGVNAESQPAGDLNYGALGYTTDGRRFRLCSLPSTGTTLAACKLIQGPAQVAGFHLGTVSANTAGDGSVNSTSGVTSVTFTFASSATETVVTNFFAGGFLSVVTGTGSPQQVQIAGNPAITTAATITLYLQDPLVLTTVNTATAELYANAYGDPIITPASALTGELIGAPQIGVTVSANSGQNTWFWAQSGGFATVLGDTSAASIGLGLSNSTATAGAVTVAAATVPQIGIATEATSSGLYTVAKLKID